MRLEPIIKVLIAILGVATFVYLISLNLPRSQGKGVIAVGVMANVALWLAAGALFNRARLRALSKSLTLLGLTVGEPSDAQIIHTLEKGQRALSRKFWASGDLDGKPVGIAEFTYTIGSGKSSQTIRNLQVWRPCPKRWPDFRLSRRLSFLRRPIWRLKSPDDYGLENEAFAKRWTIDCADKDFAVLLLNPAVQNWLMLAPKDERWAIAGGRVCVTRQRKCTANETDSLINRLDQFIAMPPQELEAW